MYVVQDNHIAIYDSRVYGNICIIIMHKANKQTNKNKTKATYLAK